MGLALVYGEFTIDATERDQRPREPSTHAPDQWAAMSAWACDLAARIAEGPTARHVAIFVPDDDGRELRLAAQVLGPGEETGAAIVGDWTMPLEGSVCGRVYRTGRASLCADVAMDPDHRTVPGSRTRSSLTVPIGPPEGVVAVINVEAPWIGAFSIRDFERLTAEATAAFETYPVRRMSTGAGSAIC